MSFHEIAKIGLFKEFLKTKPKDKLLVLFLFGLTTSPVSLVYGDPNRPVCDPIFSSDQKDSTELSGPAERLDAMMAEIREAQNMINDLKSGKAPDRIESSIFESKYEELQENYKSNDKLNMKLLEETLQAAQDRLEQNGFTVERIQAVDGVAGASLPALRLNSTGSTSLGRFVANSPFEVHYNPGQLLIDKHEASFFAYNNAVSLSSKTIVRLEVSDIEIHEGGHGRFFHKTVMKGRSHPLNGYTIKRASAEELNRDLDVELADFKNWLNRIMWPTGGTKPIGQEVGYSRRESYFKIMLLSYYQRMSVEEVYTFLLQSQKNYKDFLVKLEKGQAQEAELDFARSLSYLMIARAFNRMSIQRMNEIKNGLADRSNIVDISTKQMSFTEMHNPDHFFGDILDRELNYANIYIDSGTEWVKFLGFSEVTESWFTGRPKLKPMPTWKRNQSVEEVDKMLDSLNGMSQSFETLLGSLSQDPSLNDYTAIGQLFVDFVRSIEQSFDY